MSKIQLISDTIDEAALVEAVRTPVAGAIATFAGAVRDNNKGRAVLYLEYEAYDPMAHKVLERIAKEARERFEIEDIAIAHRTGRMEISEDSVFIAVSSVHRPAAFDACRYAIDEIKREVPIWKKEYFEGGEVWIEGPGDCEHSHGE